MLYFEICTSRSLAIFSNGSILRSHMHGVMPDSTTDNFYTGDATEESPLVYNTRPLYCLAQIVVAIQDGTSESGFGLFDGKGEEVSRTQGITWSN